MYNITNTRIENVWQFFVTKNGNILDVENKIDSNRKRAIRLNGRSIDVDSLWFEEGLLINFNTTKTDKIYSLKDEIISSIKSGFAVETFDGKEHGLLSKISEKWEVTSGYGRIHNKNFDYTFSSKYIVRNLITEKAFYLCFDDYENKKISCFLPEKSGFLWHFTLESLHQEYDLFSEKWNKPMEIANFCGIANEVLWMDVVCRGIGNFLLGLDVNTGQPIHLLDKAENRFMVYPFDMIPTDGRTTYDAKRNILFGFAPDWVHWQVDLSEKSPKIKMWDLSEEMTKHHAYVSAYMNCGISDSHIFFPVGSLGSTPQVFALNRETLKVDWQYHFTEGGQYFTPTRVEVTDTHLYVLDNTGTLHIFEKTEEN
jgi:hypothetical protein